MTSIVGIPTTRITTQYTNQRLLTQSQYAQMALYRLQMQLSTGHRYQDASDDPISSLRVMSIQSLLERKAQVQSNLSTNRSFLSTSETAISSVASIVSGIRADSLVAIETVTTSDQRKAIAQQVDQAIQQLVDIGNQKFRNRYLFSGSTTQTRPFTYADGNLIQYAGNADALLSYADVDLLFQTNVPGSEVFGAISDAGQSDADLNPSLTADTPLANLRGGAGINLGSIQISDGMRSTVIDISGAKTIGDVALLIRNNPPPDRTIDVEITNDGLKLRLQPNSDPAASENLIVREVGSGSTAANLGILNKMGAGNNWLVGEDLDPVLTKTTPLADIIGRRAYATVGVNPKGNDFILRARAAGEAYNDVSAIFENDPSVTVGNETVTYDDSDPANKVLRIGIEMGKSKISHVVKAIQKAATAGLPFEAELDPIDDSHGAGVVMATPVGETAGVTANGSGVPFDKESGLQILNAGNTFTIDLSEAETVEDLLSMINASGAGVVAEINAAGTAIDIRSRVSGCDFTIAENGGQTATQLGLRTFTEETLLQDLNYGYGVSQWDEGKPASVNFTLPGANNEVTLTAKSYGAAWNDITVQFVAAADPAEPLGLTYDRYAGTMTFTVDPATTTLRDLAGWMAADPAANADFTFKLPNNQYQATAVQELVDLGPLTTAGADEHGTDFTITRADGATLQIDLQGCKDIKDVLARINNHPDNTPLPPATAPALQARLAASGNGIILEDTSGPGELRVANTTLSQAANSLGLVPNGETSVSVNTGSADQMIIGADVNPQETEGIYTALLRLRDALQNDDIQGIQRSLDVLDRANLKTTYVRAELGSRQQSLEILSTRLEDENIELQGTLSLEYDADYVTVVSQYAAAQAALQASLQVTGNMFQMTLLNYL